MALASMLSRWSQKKDGPQIHILSVDHGLRSEAAAEAEHVRAVSKNWPKSTHYTLKWEGEKPAQRVQEAARAARYDLMDAHCTAHGVTALMLGHHRDDQAETVLFRLAKGSGLDGLAGMRPVQKRGALNLCRPLLDMSKDEILDFCYAENISYIEDPSNQKQQYARARLRQSRDALEREGLSAKRLAVTAKRMDRGRSALDFYAEKAFKDCLETKDSDRIVFNINALLQQPEEIILRTILLAIGALHPSGGYKPRMEKIESLVMDIVRHDNMKPRTLGGVIFSCRDTKLILTREGAK